VCVSTVSSWTFIDVFYCVITSVGIAYRVSRLDANLLTD